MYDLRKVFEKKLSSLGDSTISSYAKSFAKSEYKACGKDLDKLQTDYMFKTGAKMISMTLLMVIAAILKLMRMAFVLVISTEGTEGTPLAIGASSWTQKRKTKSGKIKVRVNRASVLEIFDSLGAIVFTYKNER